jgi:hypothetical protein
LERQHAASEGAGKVRPVFRKGEVTEQEAASHLLD